MPMKAAIVVIALVTTAALAAAQQPNSLELKIDNSHPVITVSAEGRVEVDPDVAILHIGFETKPADVKSAYADGSRISNTIVDAIKQAGIPMDSIHSESQRLEPVDVKNHKFKLTQNWTVKTPTARAGEILEVAIGAGATDSGEIEWTVADIRGLEDQALEQAVTRARNDAAAMAKASGVHLGNLLYLTNRIEIYGGGGEHSDIITSEEIQTLRYDSKAAAPPPLAIAPHQVVRVATVYAVFAIE